MEANNVKEMREALRKMRRVMSSFGQDLPKKFRVLAGDAIFDADQALAAPPRNCDRFGSESEMRAAFIAWYNEAFDLKGSKYAIDHCDLKHNINGILDDYIEWLCSTVEPETKGAADGGE